MLGDVVMQEVPIYTLGGNVVRINSLADNFLIYCVYNEIYDESLSPSTGTALLSILPGSLLKEKSSLLHHFLSAGRYLYTVSLEIPTHPPFQIGYT